MRDRSETFRKAASSAADGAAILTAVALPWSTSATSILIVVWFLALLPTLNFSELKQECTTSHGGIPMLLFGLGLISLLWADASLHEGLNALRPLLKLLAIPFLIVQFRKSENGYLAIAGYLISCTVLLAASLISVAFPIAAWGWGFKYPGMPVKDAIVQSMEFATCGFALLLWAGTAWSRRRYGHTLIIVFWAALFFVAILYVATSRTELIVLVVLAALLFSKWFGWKGVPIGLALASLVLALAWVTSPILRSRVTHVTWELQEYYKHNRATSAGDRLEWWRKSLEFVRAAPLIGHGVGATKTLFAAKAVGENGASALVTANPHNQIFAIAIELGLIGVATLFAMWIAHVRLFQTAEGLPWLGVIVVVQNIVGCLFNSHIFDFTQGWTYVFGVGVLGGMALSSAKEHFSAKTWEAQAHRGSAQIHSGSRKALQ